MCKDPAIHGRDGSLRESMRPRLVGRGKLGMDAGRCMLAEVCEIAASLRSSQ